MNVISIIGCVVGIVGCIIGVATFVSAQITKAKQDGMLIAKIEQCVKNTEDIKNEMKDKNEKYDNVLDEHSKAITELQVKVKNIEREMSLREGDLK